MKFEANYLVKCRDQNDDDQQELRQGMANERLLSSRQNDQIIDDDNEDN